MLFNLLGASRIGAVRLLPGWGCWTLIVWISWIVAAYAGGQSGQADFAVPQRTPHQLKGNNVAARTASDRFNANERTSVRMMSFNIRYGSANDGDNHWRKRRSLVVKTIQQFDADVIGTQETLDFQATYLAEQLPEFTYVGRSRQQDGQGEHCGILFRTSRFDKLTEGHFWLSQAPDRPGSKSWDSSLPRMATWLKLWDRVQQSSIYVVNTHFDHRGKVARVESAKLIRNFVANLPVGSKVVVTGDFNAAVGSEPYLALFGTGLGSELSEGQSNASDRDDSGRVDNVRDDNVRDDNVRDDNLRDADVRDADVRDRDGQVTEGKDAEGLGNDVRGGGGDNVRDDEGRGGLLGGVSSGGGWMGGRVLLVDSYRSVHPEKSLGATGTFNGFQGKRGGARIDWIAVSANWKITSAEIDRYSEKGRYPSDHFPVTAELEYR